MTKGKCSCGRYSIINSKGLCSECVYKKNHNGKTRIQVYNEKIKSKPKTIRKSTGELKVFLEIWSERPHICTNCNKTLYENVPMNIFVQYFSHIKSKGSHPELRLNKDNIELLCPECHYLWEFGSKEKFYLKKK